MFKDNKYTRIYYSIIKRSTTRDTPEHVERHHIIPKSMGGGNGRDNLAHLTPREHYICHALLTRMTEGKDKQRMSYAIWRMLNLNKYTVNSKLYEHLRINHTKVVSKRMTGLKRAPFSEQARKNMSEGQKGKIRGPHTPESRKKMSESKKGKCQGSTNHAYVTTKYTITHPDYGEVTDTPHNLCTQFNLSRSNIIKLFRGKSKSIKGWTLVNTDMVYPTDQH